MKTLDLRPRCARAKCNKIPRGKMAVANYQRYAPYCSFDCQEWARVEDGLRYVRQLTQESAQ